MPKKKKDSLWDLIFSKRKDEPNEVLVMKVGIKRIAYQDTASTMEVELMRNGHFFLEDVSKSEFERCRELGPKEIYRVMRHKSYYEV